MRRLGAFELFWESLRGGGTWWSNITNVVTSAVSTVNALRDDNTAGSLRDITAMFASPPTAATYDEMRSRLDSYVNDGRKLLFIAHSQGNLFATFDDLAMQYARWYPVRPRRRLPLAQIGLVRRHLGGSLDLACVFRHRLQRQVPPHRVYRASHLGGDPSQAQPMLAQ